MTVQWEDVYKRQGSEDAALLTPYANNPDNRGVLNYTQEQVNAFAIAANRAGLQITCLLYTSRCV